MNEVSLAVIAVAVAVMAVVQLVAIAFAIRIARRLDRLVHRLEHEIQPVMASLQALTRDAARATAVAAAHVDRADRLMADLAARLDEAVAALKRYLETEVEGMSWRSIVATTLAMLRNVRRHASSQSAAVDEEDALFIG